jgi:hypothetical protein
MAEINDHLDRYYVEKLWEMIPAVYRDADGDLTNGGGVLRSLVSVLAEQAAIVRRSADRVWEDQFIETCDDWAVPYVGDLLATRMVSALDRRARRVDVANTISYRRRAGTLGVLESLTTDLTGWGGTVVEEFRRPSRPRPSPGNGRVDHQHPGAWATGLATSSRFPKRVERVR